MPSRIRIVAVVVALVCGAAFASSDKRVVLADPDPELLRAVVAALAPLDATVDNVAALAAPERFDTPGVRTIDDLATGYDAPASQQVKTLVYVLDGKLTLVLLRGDHALEEQKLIDATGAVAVRPAEAEEIFAALGAHPGSIAGAL